MNSIVKDILAGRGLKSLSEIENFFTPDYNLSHDPFTLPDMRPAVDRLIQAREKGEKIVIYGDYDIDGLTATSVLLDGFNSFGFQDIEAFIPNRFVEGYGLTMGAVEKVNEMEADLIVTVDCGSLSEKEIIYAKELGMDVIVTDHHNVAPVQPPAVAVINPKRLLMDFPEKYENFILKDEYITDGIYPFLDLPGVGVAFKLIQALQTELDGLPLGQEKWLLDLVALGTVCDVVTLRDENRSHVFWGLKVMEKTRRPGISALLEVSGVEKDAITARSLGFGLGPRMNAAGRLETAQYSLDMLTASDGFTALDKARLLDDMNRKRRSDQDKIFKEAILQAEKMTSDNVLVLSSSGWNHGIIGIVAAKILEKYKKPTYVLEEVGEESKGSARSYGEFSVANAIRFSDDIITKGGGHNLAAGVTLPTKNIDLFRKRVNKFYQEQGFNLEEQKKLLLPKADYELSELSEIDIELFNDIKKMEPYGNGNPEPIFCIKSVGVKNVRYMGQDSQHLKITIEDDGNDFNLLMFNFPPELNVEVGQMVNVWFTLTLNEWMGRQSVEGMLIHMEIVDE